MLAPQWFSNHAIYAKIFLVELPQVEKLRDHRFLLVFADQLWYVPGIPYHRNGIEVECGCAEDGEKEIEKGKGGVCGCFTRQKCFDKAVQT